MTTDQHWNDMQDHVMEKLDEIKAEDSQVKEFVLKTDERKLVDATGDTNWACGILDMA